MTNVNRLPQASSFLAVRGDITRKFIVENRGASKDVLLCDPGLLVSCIYKPSQEIQKIHKIGIVAHYIDETEIRKKFGGKYHIISMKTSDIPSLIDDILSCEIILSSSLHGIIFAHAYGIPAYHIQFKDFFENGNFKFKDYYSSFHGMKYKRFKNPTDKTIDGILEYHKKYGDVSNPTTDQIEFKQWQFKKLLPFRWFLRKKYGGLEMGGKSEQSNTSGKGKMNSFVLNKEQEHK